MESPDIIGGVGLAFKLLPRPIKEIGPHGACFHQTSQFAGDSPCQKVFGQSRLLQLHDHLTDSQPTSTEVISVML